MSRGNSGRIVVEIDPYVKDQLYVALAKSKLTLKDWFLSQCNSYLSEATQPSLFPTTAAQTRKTRGQHE
jgi:hypothetical protein